VASVPASALRLYPSLVKNSWSGELNTHFHGHKTVTTKLILLSNTKPSKGLTPHI